jgi:hypothetical protein
LGTCKASPGRAAGGPLTPERSGRDAIGRGDGVVTLTRPRRAASAQWLRGGRRGGATGRWGGGLGGRGRRESLSHRRAAPARRAPGPRLAWLLLLTLAGGCSTPPPLDVADPRSVARHALDAWSDRDPERLAALTSEETARRLRGAKPGTPVWRGLFDKSWRWRAVKRWEGQLGPARVQGERVRIQFAQLNNLEVVVVSLVRREGRWLLDDVLSPSVERFAAWGEPLPETAAGGAR